MAWVVEHGYNVTQELASFESEVVISSDVLAKSAAVSESVELEDAEVLQTTETLALAVISFRIALKIALESESAAGVSTLIKVHFNTEVVKEILEILRQGPAVDKVLIPVLIKALTSRSSQNPDTLHLHGLPLSSDKRKF
ncbi:hypothetical protein FRB97_008933 [Tulasnella sp. 331]|nr:hypothetical protein FRB97_008933 [Tulasnella sp. 331]